MSAKNWEEERKVRSQAHFPTHTYPSPASQEFLLLTSPQCAEQKAEALRNYWQKRMGPRFLSYRGVQHSPRQIAPAYFLTSAMNLFIIFFFLAPSSDILMMG